MHGSSAKANRKRSKLQTLLVLVEWVLSGGANGHGKERQVENVRTNLGAWLKPRIATRSEEMAPVFKRVRRFQI